MSDVIRVRHLAIIMDGNRRWAKENGLPSLEGHRRGYDRMKLVGDWCLARKMEIVSVFAFSTENWDRTTEEVGYLMDLIELALQKELNYFHAKNIRIRVLGRREKLRPSVLRAIDQAEKATENNIAMTLCICLNYGGRSEIVDACQKIVRDGIPADQITEETIHQNLYWPDMPYPDLLIRTSGEERLSGFLLWEVAYSEFFWCQHHWPAFDEHDLDAALDSFIHRQRRFGK